MTRTSAREGVLLPTGSNSPSCSTRRSFNLSVERELADLVEKDRAAVGDLEASQSPLERARERALHVPEELALHQTRRDCAAVDLDQGAATPSAARVDGARDQLLAGARLAGDQHGGVGRRHALDVAQDLQQGRARADHLDDVVLGPDLLLQIDVLALEPRLQRRDLLVGFHVLDGHGHLVRHFLQKDRVGHGVLSERGARHAQRADARAADDQRHHE